MQKLMICSRIFCKQIHIVMLLLLFQLAYMDLAKCYNTTIQQANHKYLKTVVHILCYMYLEEYFLLNAIKSVFLFQPLQEQQQKEQTIYGENFLDNSKCRWIINHSSNKRFFYISFSFNHFNVKCVVIDCRVQHVMKLCTNILPLFRYFIIKISISSKRTDFQTEWM